MPKKVNIEDLRLNISPVTDSVFVGIIDKDGTTWKEKKDVTNDFLSCVLIRWKGCRQIIRSSDGKEYEISIVIKKQKQN